MVSRSSSLIGWRVVGPSGSASSGSSTMGGMAGTFIGATGDAWRGLVLRCMLPPMYLFTVQNTHNCLLSTTTNCRVREPYNFHTCLPCPNRYFDVGSSTLCRSSCRSSTCIWGSSSDASFRCEVSFNQALLSASFAATLVPKDLSMLLNSVLGTGLSLRGFFFPSTYFDVDAVSVLTPKAIRR